MKRWLQANRTRDVWQLARKTPKIRNTQRGSLWILRSASISPVSNCILSHSFCDLSWHPTVLCPKSAGGKGESHWWYFFILFIHLSVSKDNVSFWRWKEVQRTSSKTFSSQVRKTQCKGGYSLTSHRRISERRSREGEHWCAPHYYTVWANYQ